MLCSLGRAYKIFSVLAKIFSVLATHIEYSSLSPPAAANPSAEAGYLYD